MFSSKFPASGVVFAVVPVLQGKDISVNIKRDCTFDIAKSFFDFLTATNFEQLTISWQFINMAL